MDSGQWAVGGELLLLSARLHPRARFATLTPASRAIREDPATEQETVPGAAGKTKRPDEQKPKAF